MKAASVDEPQSMPPPTKETASDLYRIAWVFYLIMALGGVIWLVLAESSGNPCGEEKICLGLFLNLETWLADLAVGVGAALAMLGFWEVARRFLPIAAEMERRLAEIVGKIPGDETLALALLSGFSEELFFRGAVQGSLGWPLATLLFAAVHTGPGKALRFWTVYAGAAGLVLAVLMEWRGNLLAPIVTHAVVNGVGLWRLRRQPKGSNDSLDGGAEPPMKVSPLLDSDDGSSGTSDQIE